MKSGSNISINKTITHPIKNYQPFVERVLHEIPCALLKKVAVSISITFIGAYKMRRLNKIFCGHDYVTDVLTFGDIHDYNGHEPFLESDIYICYEVAQRMSNKYNHSIDAEIKLLITHALLHMCGYDHQTKSQKQTMAKLEEKILRKVGLLSR